MWDRPHPTQRPQGLQRGCWRKAEETPTAAFSIRAGAGVQDISERRVTEAMSCLGRSCLGRSSLGTLTAQMLASSHASIPKALCLPSRRRAPHPPPAHGVLGGPMRTPPLPLQSPTQFEPTGFLHFPDVERTPSVPSGKPRPRKDKAQPQALNCRASGLLPSMPQASPIFSGCFPGLLREILQSFR